MKYSKNISYQNTLQYLLKFLRFCKKITFYESFFDVNILYIKISFIYVQNSWKVFALNFENLMNYTYLLNHEKVLFYQKNNLKNWWRRFERSQIERNFLLIYICLLLVYEIWDLFSITQFNMHNRLTARRRILYTLQK